MLEVKKNTSLLINPLRSYTQSKCDDYEGINITVCLHEIFLNRVSSYRVSLEQVYNLFQFVKLSKSLAKSEDIVYNNHIQLTAE